MAAVQYDVCVIGAGIEGSSTARYSASRGKNTLLLEQFHLPHSNGSSHGTTRLVRHGYPNKTFSNLMPEAFKMWADIEQHCGKELIKRVGIFSAREPPMAELNQLVTNVRNLGVPCETLSSDDIKRRFPAFKLDGWVGSFEPESGFILANQALQAIQKQFVQFGGTLRDGEKVTKIEPGSITTIYTTKNKYRAKSVVIAAGPWVNEVLKPLKLQLPVKLWRTTLCYWKCHDPERHSAKCGFPAFLFYRRSKDKSSNDHEHIYGFPVYDYPGLIKICHHSGVEIPSPDSREEVRKNEKYIEVLKEFIAKHFHDVEPHPKIIEACMYTVTPDDSFVLDNHPLYRNIVIGAGFSGHGFKMAPVVGKILTQLALGETPSYNMTPFKISRFQKLKSSL